MSDELKVSLGVREDGTVVHITEIDAQTERGLACHCTCSECGDQLVARLGKVRQRHFAHHTVRDCVTSDESALHRFAKEVFTRNSTFRVPEARVWLDRETLAPPSRRDLARERRSGGYIFDAASERTAPAHYIGYVEAAIEKGHGKSLRPDVTLVVPKSGSPFFIEILVTHAVDDVKEAALKALGHPCIEIDLSGLHIGLDSFDRAGIEHLLIHGEGFEKDWVCVPDEEAHLADLKERLRLEEEKYRLEEEQQQREEEERLRKEEQRRKRQDALLSPDGVAASEARKQTQLAAHPLWNRNCRVLGVSPENVPYYLNERVKGEYLFTVHRSVWQSTLFLAWVFNKQDATRSRLITVKFALDNLKKVNPDFWENSLYWAHRDRGDVLDPATVVGEYFLFLRDCGFIKYRDGHQYRPLTWQFDCVMPLVAPLPPEHNNPRYLPREDGVLDRQTGTRIKFAPCAATVAGTAPNP